jgi:hypothetical protein
LALHRDTCHRLGEARTLVVLGNALRGADGERALRCWQHAHDLFTQVGTPEAEQVGALLEGRSTLLDP